MSPGEEVVETFRPDWARLEGEVDVDNSLSLSEAMDESEEEEKRDESRFLPFDLYVSDIRLDALYPDKGVTSES